MKLLFFDEFRLGALKRDRVVDLSAAAPRQDALAFGTLGAEAVIEAVITDFASLRPRFEEILAEEDGVPLASVRIRPPLPRPHNVLCAFSNYQDGDAPNRSPLDFFHKGSGAIVGDGDTIQVPNIEDVTVFQAEPEFAYVIGRPAHNVAEADALDYVFGYTNFFDVSARGAQNRRTTFLSKELDTWGPLGPAITTKDEIPDPQNVQMKFWHNGELKQDYNTAAMNNSVARQIAWLSKLLTLQPGDVISCGVHHRGLTPINDGDKIEMEGEGMGRLHLTVRSYGPRKDAHWRPPGVKD
ncbi:MAG: hypothetical protein QOF51_3802 [Chloroflexota bacterium]|jgi:2-keto-4-pentenoate hydratase/2-oxohepta-3-ene-1,7-dioic acid hydratase in catechol pathway|nr:hypothetical protein [Chloroflexota bacterium]